MSDAFPLRIFLDIYGIMPAALDRYVHMVHLIRNSSIMTSCRAYASMAFFLCLSVAICMMKIFEYLYETRIVYTARYTQPS